MPYSKERVREITVAFENQGLVNYRMKTKSRPTHKIFILSDGTGQSAIDIMRAALVQFRDHRVTFTVFSRVGSRDKVQEILIQAREKRAFVAFTFVKQSIRDFVHQYCVRYKILHYDILGPVIRGLSSYLGGASLEEPTLLRKTDERYFQRIEAIEFSIVHDDGKSLERLEAADIVIVGLSRTSKTPTSFFLAQQGYKVVNIPITPPLPLPDTLFETDQGKIVCLMMQPEVLQKVRIARLHHVRAVDNSYIDLKKIYDEIEYVEELLRKHRQWKVVDTTNKSVEETAREIIEYVIGKDVVVL
jgi:regulator of PEP synthase PpsR (kinase-PPPase family)